MVKVQIQLEETETPFLRIWFLWGFLLLEQTGVVA